MSNERKIEALGIAVSLGLAFLPLAAGDDVSTGVVLGVVGFLVGYVITMDFAGRARMREHEVRLSQQLATLEKGVYGPVSLLRDMPDLHEAISDLADAVGKARSREVPFLANRAVALFKRDLSDALQISQGRFKLDTRIEELRLIRDALEDYTFLGREISIRAVAGLGLEQWRTTDFIEYFQTCLSFPESLVQTRIFLVTRREMEDPAMHKILQMHSDVGASAYALDKDLLPDSLCRPIMLFADDLLMLHSRAPDGGFEVHFTSDEHELDKANADFRTLMRRTNIERETLVLWPTSTQTGSSLS